MGIPLRQNLRVARHLAGRRVRRRDKYPIVVELEPLFACNLRCPGCGKTDHPPEVLSRRMSVQDAIAGLMECGAPVVSIAGGEPLLHPEIGDMAKAAIEHGITVYLCTNGLLLRKTIDLFTPSPYFSWVVHVDGIGNEHDCYVGREGVFAEAIAGMQEAKSRGFRVTTNSTFFSTDSPQKVIGLLEYLYQDVGVDAVMVSPAYAQEGAADQNHFPVVQETQRLFSEVLREGRRRWRFNHSPLYLDFLAGYADLPCLPWAIPSFSVLGWQRPCYLLADGYAESYRELLETTDWAAYGRGRDPRCSNCMAHSGHEPAAVTAMLRSPLIGLRSYLRR
ncbi:MAG: adenosyl-hopene transferase HpnH [Actinobacteria bacterium]|nr:adenosyl-hopene transferase HpnH [Actinomycetota bacterium]